MGGLWTTVGDLSKYVAFRICVLRATIGDRPDPPRVRTRDEAGVAMGPPAEQGQMIGAS